MTTPTPDLLGTAAAARIMQTSHRTVHRMVDTGELKPALVAPGGRAGVYLFDPADVHRIAKTRREHEAEAREAREARRSKASS